MECGLRVDDMSTDTMNAVYELLRASLSPEGFEKVWVAMMMSNSENSEDLHRIAGYQFCLFGEPGPYSPWGFNLFGDNVCVNVFTLSGEVVIGPFFVSAGPSFTEQGLVEGVHVFEREEAAGLALMASLNPDRALRRHLRSRPQLRATKSAPRHCAIVQPSVTTRLAGTVYAAC